MINQERMSELAKKIQGWDMRDGFVPQEWLDEYGRLWAEEQQQKNYQKEEKSREMRNRRRRGKYGEKKIAKEIAGQRKGGVGMEDVSTSLFSLEVKTVSKFPASIEKGLEQARRLAPADKIPALVFRKGRDSIYCVDGKDWVDLHGGGIIGSYRASY